MSPAYGSVRSGHNPCRYCARPRVEADHAAAVLLAAGADPLDPFPGPHDEWRCRCLTCGAEVRPRYTSIRAGRGPCRRCGNTPVRHDATTAA